MLDASDGDRVVEVLGDLTEAGVRSFFAEMLRAVLVAVRTGNLRTLQETVEAWHRTMRLRQDPNFRSGVDRAKGAEPSEAVTVDELRKDLELPDPRRSA